MPYRASRAVSGDLLSPRSVMDGSVIITRGEHVVMDQQGAGVASCMRGRARAPGSPRGSGDTSECGDSSIACISCVKGEGALPR